MPKSPLPDLPGVNKLSKEYKTFLRYLESSDSEQYDIVRDRWAKINWSLLDKAEQAVEALQKGESPAKISPLIISAGIGFDKLYSKRTEQSKPLSFPAPLLEMVRKGLKLQRQEPLAKTTAAEPLTVETLTGETLSDSLADQEQPDQGGVACADPEAERRGHGPPLSRSGQSDPEISQEQKKGQSDPGISHTKKKARQARSVQVELVKRHTAKAKRAAMLEAMRQTIRETVPYQRPAEPGGIV